MQYRIQFLDADGRELHSEIKDREAGAIEFRHSEIGRVSP